MKYLCTFLSGALAIGGWLAGAVLAKGFWSTALALVFPLWGYYLCVERLLQVIGWVQ